MECYHFITTDANGVSTDIRFTDAPMRVVNFGHSYHSSPITRSSIVRGLTGHSVTVTAPSLQNEVGWIPGHTTTCRIYRCGGFDIGSDNITVDSLVNIFTGDVIAATYEGMSVTYEMSGARDKLDRPVGVDVLQRNCRWSLYSAGCGVNPDDYEEAGFVTEIVSPVEMKSPIFDLAPDIYNYWTGGRLVVGGESVAIDRYNPSTQVLRTVSPLPIGVDVGSFVRAWPGCNKTMVTCKWRFNNDENYGGFLAIPEDKKRFKA